jgi:hypothetical protein
MVEISIYNMIPLAPMIIDSMDIFFFMFEDFLLV